MRRILTVAAATMFMAAGGVPVMAQSASTPAGVMTFCPDGNQANSCATAMNEFIGANPAGPQTDGDLSALVGDIATIADSPSTPRNVCRGLADGIRAASGGAQSSATAQEFTAIADALCGNSIRVSATGGGSSSSIGDSGGPKKKPEDDSDDCNDEPKSEKVLIDVRSRDCAY